MSLDVLERKEDNVKKRILVNKNKSEKKVNPGLAKDSARALQSKCSYMRIRYKDNINNESQF